MVQKESHNHVQTHTRTKQSHWDVAPGEETYKRMHPNDIRNIYFCMNKGTAMNTHTHTIALGCDTSKREKLANENKKIR